MAYTLDVIMQHVFTSFLLGDASCFFSKHCLKLLTIAFGAERGYNIELLYLAVEVHGTKRDREVVLGPTECSVCHSGPGRMSCQSSVP